MAKKGGNTVASCIWKFLELKGLRNGRTAAEICFVFDNCTGQNKNRMVTRLLFYLVRLKICRTAMAVFLVKGHTKNDCDRMFNLMKYDYRKTNCYTPGHLINLVNHHPQVNAVAMADDDFLDWDSLQDTMIAKADGILKNHIFTVRARDPYYIMLQEYDGATISRQLLVKKAFHGNDVDWNKEVAKLKVIPSPGLPDIKWNELYYKWGRFIPEDQKQGLIYYVKKPPSEVKRQIQEQSAAEKSARKKRSRTAGKMDPSKKSK